jgi:hypothetical protein
VRRCDLDPSRAAVWYSPAHRMRISAFAAQVLAENGYIDIKKLELYRGSLRAPVLKTLYHNVRRITRVQSASRSHGPSHRYDPTSNQGLERFWSRSGQIAYGTWQGRCSDVDCQYFGYVTGSQSDIASADTFSCRYSKYFAGRLGRVI